MNASTEAEFWDLVSHCPITGCWWWTGGFMKRGMGYGRFTFCGVQYLAHRFAFWATRGYWPRRPRLVMHTCDQPACVNPKHLMDGSYKDNSVDMVSKRRMPRGDDHHLVKITDTEVVVIRAVYRIGVFNQKTIGRWFGISQAQVSRLVNNLRRLQ